MHRSALPCHILLAGRQDAGDDDPLVLIVGCTGLSGLALFAAAGLAGNGRLVAGPAAWAVVRGCESERGCAQQEQMTHGNRLREPGFSAEPTRISMRRLRRAPGRSGSPGGLSGNGGAWLRAVLGGLKRIEWAGAPVRYGMRPAPVRQARRTREAAPPATFATSCRSTVRRRTAAFHDAPAALPSASSARTRRAQHLRRDRSAIVRLTTALCQTNASAGRSEEHPPRRGSIPATLHPRFRRSGGCQSRPPWMQQTCYAVLSHLNLPREVCPWREYAACLARCSGALSRNRPIHRATTIAPARVRNFGNRHAGCSRQYDVPHPWKLK